MAFNTKVNIDVVANNLDAAISKFDILSGRVNQLSGKQVELGFKDLSGTLDSIINKFKTSGLTNNFIVQAKIQVDQNSLREARQQINTAFGATGFGAPQDLTNLTNTLKLVRDISSAIKNTRDSIAGAQTYNSLPAYRRQTLVPGSRVQPIGNFRGEGTRLQYEPDVNDPGYIVSRRVRASQATPYLDPITGNQLGASYRQTRTDRSSGGQYSPLIDQAFLGNAGPGGVAGRGRAASGRLGQLDNQIYSESRLINNLNREIEEVKDSISRSREINKERVTALKARASVESSLGGVKQRIREIESQSLAGGLSVADDQKLGIERFHLRKDQRRLEDLLNGSSLNVPNSVDPRRSKRKSS